MSSLIDVDAMMKHLENLLCGGCDTPRKEGWCDVCDYAFLMDEMKKVPTVDAIEVVRCKDCVHWIKDGKICCGQTTVGEDESSVITGENDFCSMGERW